MLIASLLAAFVERKIREQLLGPVSPVAVTSPSWIASAVNCGIIRMIGFCGEVYPCIEEIVTDEAGERILQKNWRVLTADDGLVVGDMRRAARKATRSGLTMDEQSDGQAEDQKDLRSLDQLLHAHYAELRRLATSRLRSGVPAAGAFGPTSLVHEVYLRQLCRGRVEFEDRKEFFKIAAVAMRDIIVERARKRAAAKVGGAYRRVSLDDVTVAIEVEPSTLLVVEEAIRQVAAEDETDLAIIRLRFYAGLSESQTATVMEMPLRTFQRRWQYLRVRLHRALADAQS